MSIIACQNKILTFTDEKMVGGQIFNKWPENAAEVALFWSQVWEAMVSDMIGPPILVAEQLALSVEAWRSTMELLVTPPDPMAPTAGILALSAAAMAAFPALALAIAPSIFIPPIPPAALSVLLLPAMAPFSIPPFSLAPEPVGPAAAFAGTLAAWILTVQYSVVPVPPTPVAIVLAP